MRECRKGQRTDGLWRMRRILALVLALLCALMPAVAAETSNTKEPVNLVTNGGVETLDAKGNPVGWSFHTQNYWSERTTVTTDNAYKSQHSIFQEWFASDSKNCHATYEIPVTEGASYVMRAMRNASTEGAGMMVEFFSTKTWSASGYLSGSKTKTFSRTNEVWAESEYEFTVPEGAVMAILYLSLRGSGYVYWDNLECYLTDMPVHDRYNMDAEFFYYTEWKTGSVYLNHADNFYDVAEGDTYDMEILDGGTPVFEKKGIPAKRGTTEVRFPVDIMQEIGKDYTLRTDYRAADGTVAFTKEQLICRYNRPTMINEEGRFIVDGKEFTPHMAYTTRNETYRTYAKMLGCNVGMLAAVNYPKEPEDFVNELNKFQEAGLMACVLYYFPGPQSHDRYYAGLQKVVEAVKDHPAVFSYVLMDEPSLHPELCTVDDLRRGYKIVHEIDTHHPVMTVEATPGWYSNAGKVSDMLVLDPYPGNNIGLTITLPNYEAQGREAVHGKKPLTSVIRAYRDLRRFSPDANYVRYSFFEWLRMGTDGIGSYNMASFGAGSEMEPDDIWNRPGIWEGYKYFADYEMKEAVAAMIDGEYPMFGRSEKEGDKIFWYAYVVGRDIHLIAMNRTEETVAASIPLVSYDGRQVGGFTAAADSFANLPMLYGSRELPVNLSPVQVVHYTIRPNSATNLSGLVKTRLRDISGYDWAWGAIEGVLDKNIMDMPGLREFMPGRTVTRGEFAAALVRGLGITGEGEGFTDVESCYPYAAEITAGKEKGILKGFAGGTFRPDAPISRQDLMTICSRGMRLVRTLDEGGTLAGFTDADAVADYAVADVAALLRAGIVQGNADGTLAPLGNATRAETAVIARRVMQWKDAL